MEDVKTASLNMSLKRGVSKSNAFSEAEEKLTIDLKDGGMGQQLRAFIVLPDDLDSIPTPNQVAHHHYCQHRGIQQLLASMGHADVVHTDSRRHTQIYKYVEMFFEN